MMSKPRGILVRYKLVENKIYYYKKFEKYLNGFTIMICNYFG